jgi:hypothetical protein
MCVDETPRPRRQQSADCESTSVDGLAAVETDPSPAAARPQRRQRGPPALGPSGGAGRASPVVRRCCLRRGRLATTVFRVRPLSNSACRCPTGIAAPTLIPHTDMPGGARRHAPRGAHRRTRRQRRPAGRAQSRPARRPSLRCSSCGRITMLRTARSASTRDLPHLKLPT